MRTLGGISGRALGPRALAAGAACASLLVLGACSSPGSRGSSGEPSGTVTVFAAASLKESFTALGEKFERAHPGTDVTFSFGGSDSLAAGITSGAPADVFAAAGDATMRLVTDAGNASGTPSVIARNRLEIATPPGNPEKISSLADLTDPGLKVALCDEDVPCGAAARKALDKAGVKLTPVSYEQDVRSALTKVELKEVDAALVYRTDVKAAGDKVAGVEFPESAQAVNSCPIVLLKDAPNAAAAKEFIAYVRSAEGRKVLTSAGFLAP
ncbi:molybdate ABC transporter substrate-binding protein [Streptomyces sp. GC420]|uniref:molybdate ABC transporter substrate-binding protein n=1 Tax=Streptomyces sp. GC420 TaxID=2697568 RepID=UPI00141520AC|nr:molybdate ABC transporter substrate-binding protein [Streptomyces sp. GC420]NBM17596.1 molybdate ABC transporter substrate-binding protein [Streptomyces sp. GC420]